METTYIMKPASIIDEKVVWGVTDQTWQIVAKRHLICNMLIP